MKIPLVTQEQENAFRSMMVEQGLHWMTFCVRCSGEEGDCRVHCVIADGHFDRIRRGISGERGGLPLTGSERLRCRQLVATYKEEVKAQMDINNKVFTWRVTHVDGQEV